MLLVKDFNSQSVDEWSHNVNILIEQLEVLVLWEVLEHLFEAEFDKEIPPGVVLWVVFDNG